MVCKVRRFLICLMLAFGLSPFPRSSRDSREYLEPMIGKIPLTKGPKQAPAKGNTQASVNATFRAGKSIFLGCPAPLVPLLSHLAPDS